MFLFDNQWKFWTFLINFETDFLENKNFFQKLEHRILVESTKIQNVSFPHKTAISEGNVETNRMASTKAGKF